MGSSLVGLFDPPFVSATAGVGFVETSDDLELFLLVASSTLSSTGRVSLVRPSLIPWWNLPFEASVSFLISLTLEVSCVLLLPEIASAILQS